MRVQKSLETCKKVARKSSTQGRAERDRVRACVQCPTWGLHGPGEKAAILQCTWRFWKVPNGQQRPSWECGGSGDDSLQEKQSIAFKSHQVLIHPTWAFLPRRHVPLLRLLQELPLLWAKDKKKSVDLFPGLLNYIQRILSERVPS